MPDLPGYLISTPFDQSSYTPKVLGTAPDSSCELSWRKNWFLLPVWFAKPCQPLGRTEPGEDQPVQYDGPM